MSLLFDKSGKFFLPIGCEARSIAYREVPNNRDNATSAVIYKMLQNFETLNRYTKKTPTHLMYAVYYTHTQVISEVLRFMNGNILGSWW